MGPHTKEEWEAILELLRTTERQRNAHQMMGLGFVLLASFSTILATIFYQRWWGAAHRSHFAPTDWQG